MYRASCMSSITLSLHRPTQCAGPTIQQCFIYTLEGNVLDAINVIAQTQVTPVKVLAYQKTSLLSSDKLYYMTFLHCNLVTN